MEELKQVGFSQRRALGLVGLAASTWHYRNHPRVGVLEPLPQSQRAYPNRVTAAEQEQILALVKAGFARGRSVFASWFDALDAGDPIASQKTWYRLAHRYLDQQRPRRLRRRSRKQSAVMPQVHATGVNQVWCWDGLAVSIVGTA